MSKTASNSVFDIDGKPSFKAAFPLSLQHVLAMVVGNITPAIIVANVCKLSQADKTLLVQCAFFIAGIATLLQLYPVWKFGARLPVIMGVSFAYVPTLTTLGSQYGIKAIFGAQLVGGVVAIFVGIFLKHLRKYFPPIVAGTVVLTIGLSLYTIAIKYMAGGANLPPEEFGSLKHWGVAVLTLVVVLICNQFGKGYVKLASILIGIVVGYAVAFMLGMVNFASIGQAGWFSVPKPMHFGLEFPINAIISMSIIYIVNSVQAVGDISATTVGGMGREATDEELAGGIMGNGLSSVVASFFGGLPTATYSQNVGIVAMTKVVSRYILGLAAVVILLAGFIPKIGAVMTTIPQSVLGGATITVFGMITMTGIRLIIQDELSNRNVTIVGLSLALGMGISLVPESLSHFPESIRIIFGSSAVVISSLLAFTLNIILPKATIVDEEKERKKFESKS